MSNSISQEWCKAVFFPWVDNTLASAIFDKADLVFPELNLVFKGGEWVTRTHLDGETIGKNFDTHLRCKEGAKLCFHDFSGNTYKPLDLEPTASTSDVYLLEMFKHLHKECDTIFKAVEMAATLCGMLDQMPRQDPNKVQAFKESAEDIQRKAIEKKRSDQKREYERLFVHPLTIPSKYKDDTTRIEYHQSNPLFLWMVSLFGLEETSKAWDLYQVGTNGKNTQETYFWQIDQGGRVRTAHVIRYKSDGHRDKTFNQSTAFARLKAQGVFNEQAQAVECLFGAHLLLRKPLAPVYLFESEKTALVASMIYPQALCLATSGANTSSIVKLQALAGRDVTYFLDDDPPSETGAPNAPQRMEASLLEARSKVGFHSLNNSFWEENLLDPSERGKKFDLCDYVATMMEKPQELTPSVTYDFVGSVSDCEKEAKKRGYHTAYMVTTANAVIVTSDFVTFQAWANMENYKAGEACTMHPTFYDVNTLVVVMYYNQDLTSISKI